MNITRLSLLAAFLTSFPLLGSVEAQEQKNPMEIIEKLKPGESAQIDTMKITVNQKLGGTPDKEGWYEAQSARGKFKVRLPAPFNDLTMEGPTKDTATATANLIGAQNAEGTKFSANCISRSDGKFIPDWIKHATTGLSAANPTAVTKPFTEGTFEGTEVVVRTPAYYVFAWFAPVKSSMCQLIVESVKPPSNVDTFERDARAFLSSFTAVEG